VEGEIGKSEKSDRFLSDEKLPKINVECREEEKVIEKVRGEIDDKYKGRFSRKCGENL
jgi:hypothetical protein